MRNKRKLFAFLFCLLVLGYIFAIWVNFTSSLSGFSSGFGYMDYQHRWRVLDDFVRLKIPFRDYFYIPNFGPFSLLIESVPYLVFGRTFLSLIIDMHIFLPLLGVILGYIVAKNILRKKYLILVFLFFCLLFTVNHSYNSIRHLMAELSLSFFILYFLKSKTKYLLTSGIVAGLVILTSLEYGIALNLAIFLVFFVSFFSERKVAKLFFTRFLPGEIAILAPYFSWLYIKGVLNNYWEYMYGWINNSYYASPGSWDSFPRLSDIKNLIPSSKLLIFNFPIEFLQKLSFYIVFSFFIINLIVLFILFIRQKKVSRKDLVRLSLVFYGILIFVRTLDTPAFGYFSYGLVPFFLLLTFAIEEIVLWGRRGKTPIFKVFSVLGIIFIFSWFILTENTGFGTIIFGKEKNQVIEETYEKEFYPPVGWYIRKDLTEGYKEVADYIIKNTNEDDFLYVYPWGPYNHITNRRPPNSIPTMFQFLAGEQFVTRTKMELETKKPKLIVINLYNNLGVAHYGKSRGDVARYFSLGYEDGPVFNGEGNIIEKYILENYETVLKNDLAIVMKQREKPITVKMGKKETYIWELGEEGKIELQLMEVKRGGGNYKILGKQASWTLVLTQPIRAVDIGVEFKIDGDFLTKHLSRYFVDIYALDEKREKVGETRTLARKTWQTDKVYFNQPEMVKAIKIEMGENGGLIWWMHPYNLAIRKISFYE